VRAAFGHVSKPQVWGLILWSAGIALSGTAGITQLSALLALVLDQQEQAVFQRLREWYLDANHKSGKKRRELDVTTCFAPLLRWIVRLWGNGNRGVAPSWGGPSSRNATLYPFLVVIPMSLPHARGLDQFFTGSQVLCSLPVGLHFGILLHVGMNGQGWEEC
jgi:hypothetical protein